MSSWYRCTAISKDEQVESKLWKTEGERERSRERNLCIVAKGSGLQDQRTLFSPFRKLGQNDGMNKEV